MARIKVKVTQLHTQGIGNLGVRLEPLAGQPLPGFTAGSHLDIFLPNGLVRQYSIASAPSCQDHYELCIKKEPGSRGGSRFFHEVLALGDELEVSAPRNLFALQPAEHHVLVAAGIGITPLLSMAAQLAEGKQSFTLHYYSKTREQLAYAERLAAYRAGEQLYLHFSDEGRSPRDHLPEDFQRPTAGACIYLCGPEAFMNRMAEQACDLGWAASQIHREAFAAPKVIEAIPADGAFEVELHGSARVLQVQAGQSIAQALSEAGVDVAVSCEQGFCGACLTQVLEGTPCHRDSVLTEEQKARNDQITLCCSRSQSRRLVLNL